MSSVKLALKTRLLESLKQCFLFNISDEMYSDYEIYFWTRPTKTRWKSLQIWWDITQYNPMKLNGRLGGANLLADSL
jgi:hypothetical protein